MKSQVFYRLLNASIVPLSYILQANNTQLLSGMNLVFVIIYQCSH